MEFLRGPAYRIIIGENSFKNTEDFEKNNGPKPKRAGPYLSAPIVSL